MPSRLWRLPWRWAPPGFYLIEGWSLRDSLYVAAQTVTTVGYGDLTPATQNGRIFSTVFMLVAVGVVLYALTTTVQTIVQSELVEQFGQRRQSRRMSKLRNHYIICGAGRVGSNLVRGLLGGQETFVVIERDPAKVAELTDLGVIVLVRDATLEESLREAGVEHARGLAACLPDDADNVYVVLSARDMNPGLHIVARAAAGTGGIEINSGRRESSRCADHHWRPPHGHGFDETGG